MKKNRHVVFVGAAVERVLPEVIRWGEAPWWPKRSLMRFRRLTSGEVCRGTRYRQEVRVPFGPSWDAEVESVDAAGIRRRFLTGMFEGSHEIVVCSPCEGGTTVSYEMTYQVKGCLNVALWSFFFRRLHDANIEAILANLKQFVEEGTCAERSPELAEGRSRTR